MSARIPRTRRVKRSSLDDRMDVLRKNTVDAPAAQQVFNTVNNILTLVKDKMIDSGDAIKLSEYCFDACQELSVVVSDSRADGLGEPVKAAFQDLKRIMSEIERDLRRMASTPHSKYTGARVENHKLEIRRVLSILSVEANIPIHSSAVEVTSVALDHVGIATTASVADSAVSRLVGHTFSQSECSSLIESVVSCKNARSVVQGLHHNDAQSFVDVVDTALLDVPYLSPVVRKKCLKLLYKVCGCHALVPKALRITARYDRLGSALYRGGFADVWKGEHGGRDVAVKVLRTYCNSDLRKVIGKFCKEVVTWRALNHPNILPLVGVTITEAQFAIISDWMENGNINEFVKANPDAERLALLAGVAKGLIYIHNQGMIHGDLKGANILIDQTGNARLADFGLLTIISDPANLLSSSSYTQGGTARWMSPELIAPQKFEFEDSRPTTASDCYALGMVIYETISGNPPFHTHTDLSVFVKVLEGERPLREPEFRDDLWEMLELCWTSQPSSRPSIGDVLRCLEGGPQSCQPSSPGAEEVDNGAESDSSFDSSGTMVDYEPVRIPSMVGPYNWLSGSRTYAEYMGPYNRASAEPSDLPHGLRGFIQSSPQPFTDVAVAYSLREYLKLLNSVGRGEDNGEQAQRP